MSTESKQEDHWSSTVFTISSSQKSLSQKLTRKKAYQNSASFVPKLATKVLGWLDVQKDDVILDIGCGDGIIPVQIAETLLKGTGRIHGIDRSENMISAARNAAERKGMGVERVCGFDGMYICPFILLLFFLLFFSMRWRREKQKRGESELTNKQTSPRRFPIIHSPHLQLHQSFLKRSYALDIATRNYP